VKGNRTPNLARRWALLACLGLLLGLEPGPGRGLAMAGQAAAPLPTWHLSARIIAVGLPGVAGVRQIGRFHNGGPFPSNPEFLLQTDRGRVLDPQRLMVAVASNFGAPATASAALGSALSIDPRLDRPIVVDSQFARAGGQALSAGGAVQVYSAQSAAFLNARHNANAHTAGLTSVAGPRYISINNAFGRPWIANAPGGMRGEGSLSVVDPNGAPLANAPSDDAGGVFAGHRTNRHQVAKGYASTLLAKAFNYRDSAQLSTGSLDHATLGTAFLGASPDGTGLAVFATATADGAIEQVHVQDGVDGLAPAGSVLRSDDDAGVIGMAFKWNPQRVLYVADAGRNQILLLSLDDDTRHFRVTGTRHIASPWLSKPVDLAAALPEIANPAFASHTTLAGGSDLYVANRGDGSLLRMTQDGIPLASALVSFADGSTLGGGRIRAVAVSADAARIWLTVQGDVPGFAGHEGGLIEVSAFDAGGIFGAAAKTATVANDSDLAAVGEKIFAQTFTPQTGLGPLFNEQSCVACHPGPGGASTLEAHFARRVARMNEVTGRVTTIDHPNSPIARRHSTLELGQADAPLPTPPHDANLSSLRMPIALYSSGAIEQVSDAAIEAQAVSKGDGIKGRVHYVTGPGGDLRIGRFGWKADIATLEQMVADAFGNELGITSALAAHPSAAAKDDGRLVRAVVAYLRVLAAPPTLANAALASREPHPALASQP
jgi:hypothetical protein